MLLIYIYEAKKKKFSTIIDLGRSYLVDHLLPEIGPSFLFPNGTKAGYWRWFSGTEIDHW